MLLSPGQLAVVTVGVAVAAELVLLAVEVEVEAGVDVEVALVVSVKWRDQNRGSKVVSMYGNGLARVAVFEVVKVE